MDLCISGEITVREAMEKIDITAMKIVFIVEEGKLCAALTDGDVRRAILAGASLALPP